MDPLASSRPVHSRTLDVEIRAAADATPEDGELWEARGTLVDLRRAGFVPVAGEIQTAGLLHLMHVRARIHVASGRILAIESEQPVVAFEPSARSCGESCRDPAQRIAALAECGVDEALGGPLDAAIGRERGCSHVLAIARRLLATVAWLRGAERPAPAPRRPGAPVLLRSATLDGRQKGPQGEETFCVAMQQTDVHLASASDLARPVRRVARIHEVRGEAAMPLADLALSSLRLAERRTEPGRDAPPPAPSRTASPLGAPLEAPIRSPTGSEWAPADARLGALLDHSVARGMRRRVREAFPGASAGEPAVALLLDLPGAVFQCVASRCDHWPARLAADPAPFDTAGARGSCWMWRNGGAFDRAR